MFICNFIGINQLNIAIAIRGSTYVKGILILQRADSIYMFVEDVIEVNLSGLIIIMLFCFSWMVNIFILFSFLVPLKYHFAQERNVSHFIDKHTYMW